MVSILKQWAKETKSSFRYMYKIAQGHNESKKKTIHAFSIDLDYAKISMIEAIVMVTRMVYPRNYTLYGMTGLAILVQNVMRN